MPVPPVPVAAAAGRTATGSFGPRQGAPDPLYRLRGVRYLYGRRQVALDGIDLDIWAGERLVLLGANGSGKSTLLKLLDGIIAPAAGSMRALGRDVAAVADGHDAFAFHREVGLVFQDPDVQLFSATVFDDVAFGPLQLGLPSQDVKERADEALATMGISGLADRAPFELSGGEKKRAAIASVLSLRPSVILLDEPTASLDPRTKWVLVDLLGRLGAAGRTLITATHELDIVPIIADRVVVLGEDRRVLADGMPEAILADRDMLIRANLIHEHLHQHGAVRHRHAHEVEHHHAGPADAAGTVEGLAAPAAPGPAEPGPR
ncbi:MAG: energy-coupling factor ABC transporter ATP-binding protein [Candidatus Limnocylindrales bacterium]